MKRARRGLLLAAAAAGVLLATTLVEHEVPGVPVAAPAPLEKQVRKHDPPVTPSCDSVAASWSVRERLAQLLMIGVPGNVDGATKPVRDYQVGGVFVHANPAGLLVDGRLAQVRAAAKVPLTVAIDEEGGRVQTVDPLAGSIPSARQMAATMSPDQVRAQAADRGKFLSTAGVTMNFAPVVDVSSKPANTVIGDRSFSGDPAKVKQYAIAFAAGLSSAGVAPVLKHFPGHGNVDSDSHKTTAVTADLNSLEATDLVPYQDLGDYGRVAVMVGHLVVPGLTGQEPATLSPAAYKLLREQFRFDGLVVTDDLGGMRAISDRYDLPEAVLRAIAAGADVALWSSGARVGDVLDRLEAATRSGELSADRLRDAVQHVLTSKGMC
ncbi:beta-N-acetylhexosaminidase [Kibdelosporangium banguiense]|uniref:beta-N-acetylhexosaminidase n=1 Tax=Kibdelosporangium banguiense TaxID=1365924 RepID=A0ABS4TL73_9PSEU|nr:glycoside hydrolase family 3 N-terminal domain-containing protein [Kibdelosporangium banguiense]MBP2325079.1 beta-N-acetylhexosaminidase [Kibdelosporangium banguiense]